MACATPPTPTRPRADGRRRVPAPASSPLPLAAPRRAAQPGFCAFQPGQGRAGAQGPRALLGLGHLLSQWREELPNYLDHLATNGFATEKNRRLKVIMRSGYGYRNMTNRTQRILMANDTTPAAGRSPGAMRPTCAPGGKPFGPLIRARRQPPSSPRPPGCERGGRFHCAGGGPCPP